MHPMILAAAMAASANPACAPQLFDDPTKIVAKCRTPRFAQACGGVEVWQFNVNRAGTEPAKRVVIRFLHRAVVSYEVSTLVEPDRPTPDRALHACPLRDPD